MPRVLELWKKLTEKLLPLFEPVAQLGVRLGIGFVFYVAGKGKLEHLDQAIENFRKMGIPKPELQTPFVAAVECFGGILVILGLATRIAAPMLMGTMVVALAVVIGPATWVNDDKTIKSFPEFFRDLCSTSEFLYLVGLAWLATRGPGVLSLDAIAKKLIFKGSEEKK